jgi:hypothetical protein
VLLAATVALGPEVARLTEPQPMTL